MEKTYQVTLFDKEGRYRPASCLIQQEEVRLDDKANRKELVNKGVVKICALRMWTARDLQKYGLLFAKVREYDKAKIDAENKARYEKIKEEKYASGEWKRPKNRVDKQSALWYNSINKRKEVMQYGVQSNSKQRKIYNDR